MTKLKLIAANQGATTPIVKKVTEADKIQINSLKIEGNNSYPRAYILGKLQLKYYSKYTREDLYNGINNLAATGNFDRINYNFIPNDSSYTLSLIHISEPT